MAGELNTLMNAYGGYNMGAQLAPLAVKAGLSSGVAGALGPIGAVLGVGAGIYGQMNAKSDARNRARNEQYWAAVQAEKNAAIENEMSGILGQLLQAADVSAKNSWDLTTQSIGETMQERGLYGSGIHQAALEEAGRKHATDYQAQKQSIALDVYKAYLQKTQQDQSAALAQQQLADARSKANQDARGNVMSVLGNVIAPGVSDWFKNTIGGGAKTANKSTVPSVGGGNSRNVGNNYGANFSVPSLGLNTYERSTTPTIGDFSTKYSNYA